MKPSDSTIRLDDYLLFSLLELTDGSMARIYGYFMDLASNAANSPSNVFARNWSGKKRIEVGKDLDMKFIVYRGYYPNTPIAYKMVIIGPRESTGESLTITVNPIGKSKWGTRISFKELRELISSDALLGDSQKFQHAPKKPRILTPTGAKQQPFRRKKKK